MLVSEPGMASEPGMLASEPGMLASEPGMLASEPGMLASEPGILVPVRLSRRNTAKSSSLTEA